MDDASSSKVQHVGEAWLEDFREARRSILHSRPHGGGGEGLRSPQISITDSDTGRLSSRSGPSSPTTFTLELYQVLRQVGERLSYETNQNIGKLKSEIKSIMDMLLIENGTDEGRSSTAKGGGGEEEEAGSTSALSSALLQLQKTLPSTQMEALCPPSSLPPPPPPPLPEMEASIPSVNHHQPHPPSEPAPKQPRPEIHTSPPKTARRSSASRALDKEGGGGGGGDPKERVKGSDLQQLLVPASGIGGGKAGLSSPLTSSSSSEGVSPDSSSKHLEEEDDEKRHDSIPFEPYQQPRIIDRHSRHRGAGRELYEGGTRGNMAGGLRENDRLYDLGKDGGPGGREGQNYTYLLAMMREEREAARRQEYRINELEHELIEVRQEWAISLDGVKLETLELKKMLRRMAAESTFADVFQVYEAHIARVEREVHMLRERNVQLELRAFKPAAGSTSNSSDYPHRRISSSGNQDVLSLDGSMMMDEDGFDSEVGSRSPTSLASYQSRMRQQFASPGLHQRPAGVKKGGAASGVASSSPSKQRLVGKNGGGTRTESHLSRYLRQSQFTEGLRKQVKDLQREITDMKKENAELRRRERQFMVQKRMVESTWARVHKVQGLAKSMESNLASCRLQAARAEARLSQSEDEVRALRMNEDRLRKERDNVLLELDLVQRRLEDGETKSVHLQHQPQRRRSSIVRGRR